MTRLILCAAAALAACSSEPQRNEGASAPRPTRPAGVERLRDTGALPRPGKVKVFGDWAVGCDNTRRCELRSLAAENEPPGGVTVAIAREAGPAGRLDVKVEGDDDTLATSVDGQPARTTAEIVAAMAKGRVLAARAAGKAAATVSLRGVSAALRYTDAVQGRAGTATALVAKGLKPASAVPAPAPAPTIVALVPGGTPATVTPEQLAAMRRAAACEEGQRDAPELHALGGGRTLVLLPCSAGAYNLSQALFVLDGKGFAPAQADAPVGFTGEEKMPVPAVVNGRWDKGVLTSYAKGRGLGDCGVAQELVWDGTRLRLSEQREMGECRGNIDYITTWRADVVRR